MAKRKAATAKSTTAKSKKAKVDNDTGTNSSTSAATSSTTLVSHLTNEAWKDLLADEFKKPYFKEIETFLDTAAKSNAEIFPQMDEVFNALNMTSPDDIRVVILGQDPYHDVGQAHGLAFSVNHGVAVPPSLKNIYKELSTDIKGFKTPEHGCLELWAKQGILLLNATLTVQAHKPNSHSKIGWQKFTDAIIKAVNGNCSGVVFILWGGFAQQKGSLVDELKHTVIKAAHPSPLSVTKFLGCKCFSQTNAALTKAGKKPVNWQI